MHFAPPRLERTYVYRRPIHQLKRLHNSIRSIGGCRGQRPGLRLLSTQEIKLCLLNTKTTKHFVPSFIFSTQCTPGFIYCNGYLLAVFLSTFRPTCIVLLAALSERAYRRRYPRAMLNFPRPPGYLVMGSFARKGCFVL